MKKLRRKSKIFVNFILLSKREKLKRLIVSEIDSVVYIKIKVKYSNNKSYWSKFAMKKSFIKKFIKAKKQKNKEKLKEIREISLDLFT